NGKKSISEAGRRALQYKHGLGAWTLSGAFYGASFAAIEPQIARGRDHFMKSGQARYVAHEDAAKVPPLPGAINAFSGLPTPGDVGLVTCGRVLPGTPMDGKIANQFQQLCRTRLIARILTSGRGRTPATAGCRRRSPNAVCSSAARRSIITTCISRRPCQASSRSARRLRKRSTRDA